MKIVRNILTVIAVSTFLFACEAENNYADDNVIEDVKSSETDQEQEAGSSNADR